ncbi:MAG: hypothetical protein EOP04_23940, partial [Proteobacteria bacterium]
MVKFGLGTAQIGIPYGNRSHEEVMSLPTAKLIIEQAVESGVAFFDTASAYGASEARLGQFDVLKQNECEVVTKLPPIKDWMEKDAYIESALKIANESLSKADFVYRIKICRKEAKETKYKTDAP